MGLGVWGVVDSGGFGGWLVDSEIMISVFYVCGACWFFFFDMYNIRGLCFA